MGIPDGFAPVKVRVTDVPVKHEVKMKDFKQVDRTKREHTEGWIARRFRQYWESKGRSDAISLVKSALWICSANMRLERFVALPFIGPFHFINCVADRRS